jgi:pimeloyl-ACP methyl ester carboxylesterase
MQTSEEHAWQAIAPIGLAIDFVDLNDSRVFTVSAGAGKTPVVLISGLGDSTLTWAPILPRLAASCRVIAYDRPGMGASPSIEGPRSLERMAAEVAQLIESLNDGPVVLVGHSLGGLIAVEAFRRSPDLVAGLVLVDSADPAVLSRKSIVALQRFSIWLPRAFAAVGLWPRIARSVARREAETAVRDTPFKEALAQGLLENLLSDSSRRTSSAELAGLVDGSTNALTDVSADSLDVPLVVLSATKGGTSKNMRAEWTGNHRILAESSSQGRHLEIDGGHYLHREQPSAIVDEVLAVLKGIQDS